MANNFESGSSSRDGRTISTDEAWDLYRQGLALCMDAEETVQTVLDKMMKSSRDDIEAAVAMLFAVCHEYKDRRAADTAAASESGLTRLLLLLQSGCSLAARQMALEPLKIYRVNAKSCLADYDSKTTHIMPF